MINYIKGDATNPIGDEQKVIVHVCNNLGGWGRGFVLSLSKRWKEPENTYRQTYKNFGLTLGDIQSIRVSSDVTVINMIAQKGYGKNNSKLHKSDNEPNAEIPLQYDALEMCMKKVSNMHNTLNFSIHAPRFGCGLGGASWGMVENLIKEHWHDINVYIYDL